MSIVETDLHKRFKSRHEIDSGGRGIRIWRLFGVGRKEGRTKFMNKTNDWFIIGITMETMTQAFAAISNEKIPFDKFYWLSSASNRILRRS